MDIRKNARKEQGWNLLNDESKYFIDAFYDYGIEHMTSDGLRKLFTNEMGQCHEDIGVIDWVAIEHILCDSK